VALSANPDAADAAAGRKERRASTVEVGLEYAAAGVVCVARAVDVLKVLGGDACND
jgi:hypothetical protein